MRHHLENQKTFAEYQRDGGREHLLELLPLLVIEDIATINIRIKSVTFTQKFNPSPATKRASTILIHDCKSLHEFHH